MRRQMFMATVVAIFLVSSSMAHGQISAGSVGLLWTSAGGATAGSFGCGPNPFSCTIDAVSVAAGDQFTMTVRGQLGGSYHLALSAGSVPCTSIPGIVNQLLINPNLLLILAPGVMSQPDSILACPGGVSAVSLAWPAGISAGQQLYLQAIAMGPAGQLAFTNAIQINTL